MSTVAPDQLSTAPAAVTGQDHPPAAAPVRFRHIDSLRAVAALLVVWLHFAQFLKPLTGPDPWFLGWLQTAPRFIDVGRLGVIIFFAISGFVICRSFGGPREGAGKRFVVRRLCRLYPAFWVSMLGGLWNWWYSGYGITWKAVAANATMGPMFFDQPCLIGVYWTLHIELVFYALCLCLHRTRWLERPATLAAVALALTALSRYWRILDREGTVEPVIGRHLYALGLAVMIWGALFRTVYDQTHGFRRGVFAHRGAWLVLGVAVALPVILDPRNGYYMLGLLPAGHHPPSHFATAVGIWVFAVWVAALRLDHPILAYLGAISYSLYLFHVAAVLTVTQFLTDHPAVRAWELPDWLYFVVAGAPTLAVAMAVYRWVERPAIARGKRWTGPDLTPAVPPVAVG